MTATQAGPPTACAQCWAVLGRHDRFCGVCGAGRGVPLQGSGAADGFIDPVTEPIALPRHGAAEPGADRAAPSPATAVNPPAWVLWPLIGGLVAIGLSALYSGFAGLSSGAGVAVGLLNAVVLIGLTVLSGLAVCAVLNGTRDAAAVSGVVAGAGLTSALGSAAGQGLGLLAAVGVLVTGAGTALLASVGADHDPLAAARRIGPVAGAGFLVLALRETLEVGSYSSGSGSVWGIGGSLLAGVGLVAARYAIGPPRRARVVIAVAAVLGLIAVTSANGSEASGWLVLGTTLGVVVLLYLAGPSRLAVGKAPLPGLVSMRESVRRLLAYAAPSNRDADAGAPALIGLLRIVPWWFWVTLAVGIVVVLTGSSEYYAHAADAKACTVVDTSPISIVRDTPACDAAFAGQDHGTMIMSLGGLIALGPICAYVWLKDKLARFTSS